MVKRFSFLIFWTLIIIIFFFPVFQGKIPAPLDTIVGMYHPWRDKIWDGFKNGVPFKNFLITDPVRQQIPYRFLAIESLKKGDITSWNPYSFSGTPLSANIQSGLFYPLNFYFFFLPFTTAWTIHVILPLFLGGIFIYSYLNSFHINKLASFLGALSFAFSGFFIAWLEWGTLTHVIFWLPLIILAQERLVRKINFRWLLILFFAQTSQLLAGHFQVSFYVWLFSFFYLLLRIIDRKNLKKITPFLIIFIFTGFFVSSQYRQLLRFINLSGRSYDLPDWQSSSWFLPWQNLVQLFVPDFFGNPSTLNYWGEWNYGEFISYIGIIPLTFAFYAVLTRRDKKTLFYTSSLLILLVLVLPTPLAKFPFVLNLPLLSTAQPTRLISLIVFSLSVLAALGLDWYLRDKDKKRIFLVIAFIALVLFILWMIVLCGNYSFDQEIVSKLKDVTFRNLFLPSLLLITTALMVLISQKYKNNYFVYLLVMLTVFDLFRFGWKFTPFSKKSWFYPETETIAFLKNQKEPFRIMSLDRKIFPPNFSIIYKIEDVAGYDPLYLENYAKLVQVWNTQGQIVKAGQFNRIITPTDFESIIADLLNVRFILSLSDLDSPKLTFRFREGETRIYENQKAFPRLFLVNRVIQVANEEEEARTMFFEKNNLRYLAVSREKINLPEEEIQDDEKAEIIQREENYIKIETKTRTTRLLILSEINYPSWKVYIDGQNSEIKTVDLTLRAVIVPQGNHLIEFRYEDV